MLYTEYIEATKLQVQVTRYTKDTNFEFLLNVVSMILRVENRHKTILCKNVYLKTFFI